MVLAYVKLSDNWLWRVAKRYGLGWILGRQRDLDSQNLDESVEQLPKVVRPPRRTVDIGLSTVTAEQAAIRAAMVLVIIMILYMYNFNGVPPT